MGGQSGMSVKGDDASSDPDVSFAAVVISHARLSRQISEYVAQKATDTNVKKLAQDISTDQQEVSTKVQDAAKKEGITLQTDRMLPRDQATLDFLKQLPTASLERMYLFQLAGTNQTHQLMAQWAAKNAKSPEMKQAAQDLATKLEQRGATIDKLAQAQINNPSPTAGER